MTRVSDHQAYKLGCADGYRAALLELASRLEAQRGSIKREAQNRRQPLQKVGLSSCDNGLVDSRGNHQGRNKIVPLKSS
jgi:hypothetical protein